MTEPPEVPDLSAGLSREEARALKESFEPDEQARIQETVADLLDLLGRAHAMAVLSEFAFAEEPLRFSDLEERLEIAPNTLSARLSEFTEAGLLDRTAYDEIPPRVEYTPTDRAEALFPVFAHLHHWAMEHSL
jgi:DNA-binding HxlR family transcriptional regulator